MMNLQLVNYFLLIPSVLAIIMVSRVHPFPYTETKSWIHQEQPGQNAQLLEDNHLSSDHKASRSSFGGECPDCLSQEEASLSLRLPPSSMKRERMMMAFLPPPPPQLAAQQGELDYEQGEDEDVALSSEAGDAADESSSPLLVHLNGSSFSKSSDSNLSSYYKNVGRRRRIRRSSSFSIDNSSLQKDLSSSSRTFIISRNARDTASLTPCLAEREERVGQARSSRSSEYIPNCRRDGSYAHVQCHPSTRSCWCVTRNGRPIPGSSVLSTEQNPSARPSCAKYNRRAKSTTRRRSSQFRKNRKCKHSSCIDVFDGNDDDNDDDEMDSSDDDDDDDSADLDDDRSGDVEFSRDLSCNQADWTRFNIALLKTFRSEYNRYRSLTATASDMESASDTTVLAWKFDHVDRNKDMILQRNETNILKNLVKQQIQPRSCAKNFIVSCSNGDSQITKSEWLDCLRVSSDVNLPFDTFNSLVDSSTSRGMHPSLLLKPVSSSSTSASGSGSLELTPPFLSSGTVGETTEQSNCWTDRQSALASQKQNESIIIPECTPGGNYRRVQCAQGKAYCWCVEEESGVQIPNTVVFNTTPDCNNGYSKPMKGCSGAKKHKFLMDLFSTLKSRMAEATRDGGRRGQELPRNISPEEQATRWYFSELDVNTNGVLDRREWKTFRNETSQDKRLKKCGKKLPRHCDVNQDKKITMTEWLDCLGVKFLGKVPAQTSRKRPVNRFLGRGKNPFTTILKQRRRR